ncbi:ergothioneine biosynthesis protein EgtB [Sulfobacillus harzensis]|uniref:Ergothioneine biosynthesis protein EgtB n=1 Tax=Sulfobacillus harzensis TaxID=2729629 RepID=A0A7Y0L369_9FIRM|nr:ergothioneine biosynthesis protein EgtB [Sulfobacillus harzensis]NMP22467.1 ergothioneine biosynthesis protein EgtB [Sulfobacillus harzensis]
MMEDRIPGMGERGTLLDRYRTVRTTTEALCAPLANEDYGLQAMPDASPPKWHLAHTTWFFETFILEPLGVPLFNPQYRYLFNSYYESVGRFWPRSQRGLLSRPTVSEIYQYRATTDERLKETLLSINEKQFADLYPVMVLGLNHEQQHQELLMTDILYNFSINPLRPRYRALPEAVGGQAPSSAWLSFPGGLVSIGFSGDGFCFDNERPRHQVWLEPFEVLDRLVTNAEYWMFMEDGGYRRPELWLSDGWRQVHEFGWQAPLYWYQEEGEWYHFTLGGPRPVDWDAPVAHVSYYEADAYARWSSARLPREAEWEAAADTVSGISGTFLESGRLMPQPVESGEDSVGLHQMYGEVWQWTESAYAPYPGYRPLSGALGEYNGKFMSSQQVLRGGSCVTPHEHIRPTYRNFFPPQARWQFSGIRLARDAHG